MLDSSNQAFFDIIDKLLYEVGTFLPNLVEIGAKINERHQLFEIQDKMAAAAMLDFSYQAFFDIPYVLLFEGATFSPPLVKIGQEIRERHQFPEIQDGGNRHAGFRLPGISRYH